MAEMVVIIKTPKFKEVKHCGPYRTDKRHAELDSLYLERGFFERGEGGLRSVVQMLTGKLWSSTDVNGLDALRQKWQGHKLGNSESGGQKPLDKAVPIGEGWVKYSDGVLHHPQANVFFGQQGQKRGRYFTAAGMGVAPPHVSKEAGYKFIGIATATSIEGPAKVDRLVALSDVNKTARLALKFPLSFLDQPCAAVGFFAGARGAAAADFCAQKFHLTLLPALAEKIQRRTDEQLQTLLETVLRELERLLLESSAQFSGCSAVLAVLEGERIAIVRAGAGAAYWVPDAGSRTPDMLIEATEWDQAALARSKIPATVIAGELKLGAPIPAAGDDEVKRILSAPSSFEILQVEPGDGSFGALVKGRFRKLAVKVHPDKFPDTDPDAKAAAKTAFEKIDAAMQALECLDGKRVADISALKAVLAAVPNIDTKEGCCSLLGIDATADVKAAEERGKKLTAQLAELGDSPDVRFAIEAVKECQARLGPKGFAVADTSILKLCATQPGALGYRDLRAPEDLTPLSIARKWTKLSSSGQIVLLAGASASLAAAQVREATVIGKPKATVISLLQALGDGPAASAVSFAIEFEDAAAAEPPAKKAKVDANAGIRLRHILLRHKGCPAVPGYRPPADLRTKEVAERRAVAIVKQLEKLPAKQVESSFIQICRKESECPTAQQPAQMCGDLGWLQAGAFEPAFEAAARLLKPGSVSDVVCCSDGVHVLLRLG